MPAALTGIGERLSDMTDPRTDSCDPLDEAEEQSMDKIPKELIRKHRIEFVNSAVIIRKPMYLRISDAVIEKGSVTYNISNEYLSLTLWNDIDNVHITVYDGKAQGTFK